MNMNDVLKTPKQNLEILKTKVYAMIEGFSEELFKVVRYRDYEYHVPAAIEKPTKYMILHHNNLVTGKRYEFQERGKNISFIIDEQKDKTYSIRTFDEEGTCTGKSNVTIEKKDQRIIHHE